MMENSEREAILGSQARFQSGDVPAGKRENPGKSFSFSGIIGSSRRFFLLPPNPAIPRDFHRAEKTGVVGKKKKKINFIEVVPCGVGGKKEILREKPLGFCG